MFVFEKCNLTKMLKTQWWAKSIVNFRFQSRNLEFLSNLIFGRVWSEITLYNSRRYLFVRQSTYSVYIMATRTHTHTHTHTHIHIHTHALTQTHTNTQTHIHLHTHTHTHTQTHIHTHALTHTHTHTRVHIHTHTY